MGIMAMPTTTKDVRLLAKRLGSRPELFSCEHSAFTDDQRLICDCLGYVAIASNAASVFPTFGHALAGAPASEWMFDFIDALGVDALMARPGDPSRGADPLQHLRDAMRAQLQQWWWDARLGAAPQQRAAAAKQFQRIASALGGNRRGRWGRPHDPFHVQLTYVMSLYRVARAKVLLRARWGRSLADRIQLVAKACRIATDQMDRFGHIATTGEPVRSLGRMEDIARILTAKECGLSEQRVKNILSAPVYGRYRRSPGTR
jgi:hypothetical protein